jgi:hypothetical protein
MFNPCPDSLRVVEICGSITVTPHSNPHLPGYEYPAACEVDNCKVAKRVVEMKIIDFFFIRMVHSCEI